MLGMPISRQLLCRVWKLIGKITEYEELHTAKNKSASKCNEEMAAKQIADIEAVKKQAADEEAHLKRLEQQAEEKRLERMEAEAAEELAATKRKPRTKMLWT